MGVKLESVDLVPDSLRQRSVAIGEHHEKPEGRDKAIEMINEGLVRQLFVELPPSLQLGVDAGSLAQIPKSFQNSRSQADVIGAALNKKIKVHCVDHRRATLQRESDVPMRNRHIEEQIKKISMGNFIGGLLLIGGSHLDGENGPIRLDLLDWIIMG